MTDENEKIMMDALATMQIIASLKLPKKTRLIGTRDGMDVHRPDGISYRIQTIPPLAS